MLLDKFIFIKPEHYSGFEPKSGVVPVIKKHNFRYVNLGTIIGDAPKCMISLYEYEAGCNVRRSNCRSWKKFIAKSASKWYPNESITEHLLNELGKVMGLRMANSKLRRINNQIWFLSEYFIKKDYQLYHGADLFTQHFNDDREFVDGIQNNKKIDDQSYFTVQLVKEALDMSFPVYSEKIFSDFILMLIFDGVVGNNDRHSYNWGVITSIRKNHEVCFAPIYDTARGLFWNESEEKVKSILNSNEKLGHNPRIDKYIVIRGQK